MAHFYKNETPQTSCLGPQWLGSCRWRPLSRKCFRGSREAPLPTHTRDLGQGLWALGVGCGPPGSPELGLRGRCKGPAVPLSGEGRSAGQRPGRRSQKSAGCLAPCCPSCSSRLPRAGGSLSRTEENNKSSLRTFTLSFSLWPKGRGLPSRWGNGSES